MGKKLVVALTLLLAACNMPAPRTFGDIDPKLSISPFIQLPNWLCGTDHHRCVGVTVRSGAIQPIGDEGFNSANHVVFFYLTNPITDPYTFPDNAITFVTAPLPPPNEFSCRTGNNGLVVVCINRNTTTGTGRKTYKYTVKVNGVGAPLDPFFFND